MSFLSMMEARLPPGFRFHPRDEELVCDYLEKKISDGGSCNGCPVIIDVDFNKCEPWDLPEMACIGGKEWYFFSLRDRKYAIGCRMNRATMSGYWKATGKDRPVMREGELVGMRKTLVFYQGRAAKGKKTDWVMHEFRMEMAGDPPQLPTKDWVLCRVFFRSRNTFPKSMLLPPTPAQTVGLFHNYEGITSLPSLLDTYMTFDDHGNGVPTSLEAFEQVPCFSNPSGGGQRWPLAEDCSQSPCSVGRRPEEEASMNSGEECMESYLSPVAALQYI